MKTKGLLMIVFLIGMFFSAQAADHVKGNGKPKKQTITSRLMVKSWLSG